MKNSSGSINYQFFFLTLIIVCLIKPVLAQTTAETKSQKTDTVNLKIKFTYSGSGIAPGEIVRVIEVNSETKMVTRVILETLQEQGFIMKNLDDKDYALKQNTLYQSEIKSLSDDFIKTYNTQEMAKLTTTYYYGESISFRFAIDNKNQEAQIKLKTKLMKRGVSSSWSDYTGNYNSIFFENDMLNLIAKKLNALYPLKK